MNLSLLRSGLHGSFRPYGYCQAKWMTAEATYNHVSTDKRPSITRSSSSNAVQLPSEPS